MVDAFIENFRQEEELGAATSLVMDGETVVDLWGGWAREDRSQEWDEHSTVCMMSVAKGITGIAFNMAVERGLIDIDKPVAHYWPEFAQAGKQDILVRWCLDHRAAIPVLTTDTMYPGGFFDYAGLYQGTGSAGAAVGAGHARGLSRAQSGLPAGRDHAPGDRHDSGAVPA